MATVLDTLIVEVLSTEWWRKIWGIALAVTLVALLALGMAACGNGPPPTPAALPPTPTPSISAEEYRQTTIALFNELLAMVEDGVVSPVAPDLGFAAGNPRAMRWRENVEDMRRRGDGLPFNDQCWPIGETIDGLSNVCGSELSLFITDIVADDWDEYQKLLARFSQLTETP